MKKLILMVVCIQLCCTTLFAGEVPQAIEMAFAQKFPTAKKVKWEKEKNGNFEAEFLLNGTETSATYSADGKWLETETEIEVRELPAPVLASVTKLYPGAKIKEAARILRSDNSEVYEAEVRINLKSEDLLFHADGSRVN